MVSSVYNNVVAYRRKEWKVEVWIIRIKTEAWEILWLSSIQVELNLFNDNYESMSFTYFYCIIAKGNFGKNFLNQCSFYHIVVLFECINRNKIPLGVVKARGL